MKIELKDVLHLYMGCDCLDSDGTIYTLKPSHFPNNWKVSNLKHKPVLRRLDSMTEEEKKAYIRIKGGFYENEEITIVGEQKMGYRVMHSDYVYTLSFATFTPNEMMWLLKHHFDLFHLIESGLALPTNQPAKNRT